jgi:hypothetical protein
MISYEQVDSARYNRLEDGFVLCMYTRAIYFVKRTKDGVATKRYSKTLYSLGDPVEGEVIGALQDDGNWR